MEKSTEKSALGRACFSHSWDDINPEIICSQMLHSAIIYQ